MITHHTHSVYFLWLKRSIKFTEWQFGLFTMSAKTIHIQLYLCFEWTSNKPEHFVWILLALSNLCSASVTQKFYKKSLYFRWYCCLLPAVAATFLSYLLYDLVGYSRFPKCQNHQQNASTFHWVRITTDCRSLVAVPLLCVHFGFGFSYIFCLFFQLFFFQILLSVLWFLSSSRSCVSLLLSLVTTSFFRQYIRIQTH